MCLLILVLLLGIGSLAGSLRKLEEKPFEVERHDNGDAFADWPSDWPDDIEKDCRRYGGYPASLIHPTADCNTTLGCCCNNGNTFYTFSGTCARLQDAENSTVKGGNYRFDRSGLPIDTSVSTMQGYFVQDNEQLFHCILVSTIAHKMLPVMFKGIYSLGSCNVTDIYIVHYCKPQKLPQVTAKLEQNHEDEMYYLHLESIPPEVIPKFYGELLQVAINCSKCDADYLFFKFAGKTILNQNKTFLNVIIPAYDPIYHPNNSNCSTDVPTPEPSNGANKNNAMIYIITGPLTVCIVLVMILTGYYYKCERRRRPHNEGQRLLPEGEERLGPVQPQPQPPGPAQLVIPPPPVPVTCSVEESVESSTTRSTRSSKTLSQSQSATVHLLTSQAPQNV